jgi:hypothetical protein
MMASNSYLKTFLRLLKTAAWVVLGIFVAVGLIGWFGGWRTASPYSQTFTLIGAIALFLAALALVLGRGWGMQRGFYGHWYWPSGLRQSEETVKREMKRPLSEADFTFFAVMVIIGIVSIGVGVLVSAIWG